MRHFFTIVLFLIFGGCTLFGQKASDLKYVDASDFLLINKGFKNTEMLYSRLPSDMKEKSRKEVWDLGLNSAGLAVRFSTDSKCIGAQWTLLNNFSMSHMPGTGIRGLDLYTLENGKWHFIGTAQPNGKESRNVFVRKMDGTVREYMAYLPLYDGVVKLEIGIDSSASIAPPKCNEMAVFTKKPLLFYGTSITQGGCASRPGMVYTSIIGRELRSEAINLGFSGNARMDFTMAEAIASVDAAAYIIDCLPNCTAQMVRDSAYRFITHIAQAHPDRPIYLVENIQFPHALVDKQTSKDLIEKNKEWAILFKKLRKEGFSNIKYIKNEGLIGEDAEATVDGCHLTDLGFTRMAKGLLKHLK